MNVTVGCAWEQRHHTKMERGNTVVASKRKESLKSKWEKFISSTSMPSQKQTKRGQFGHFRRGVKRGRRDHPLPWSGSATLSVHGEDALFVDEHCQVVVDGVGGTQISSAAFAQELCQSIAHFLHLQRDCATTSPFAFQSYEAQLLQSFHMGLAIARRVWRQNEHIVAAAVAICVIDSRKLQLHVLTLGDCKVVVIRDGHVVFESTSTERAFNHPAMVTNKRKSSDEKHALYEMFPLRPGDVILSCSDGVSDNLYKSEIAQLVNEGLRSDRGPSGIAAQIVASAHYRAKSRHLDTPAPSSALAAMELKAKTQQHRKTVLSKKLQHRLLQCEHVLAKQGPLMRSKSVPLGNVTGYSKEKLAHVMCTNAGKVDDTSIAVSILTPSSSLKQNS